MDGDEYNRQSVESTVPAHNGEEREVKVHQTVKSLLRERGRGGDSKVSKMMRLIRLIDLGHSLSLHKRQKGNSLLEIDVEPDDLNVLRGHRTERLTFGTYCPAHNGVEREG